MAAALTAPAPPSPVPLHVTHHTRALVVSPHPDDAVLGAGGLIDRIVRRGGTVMVVEMTSGDGFPKGVAAVQHAAHLSPGSYRSYGSLREREVAAALRQVGVPRSRVRMLGFPDEGMCEIAADAPAAIFQSPYTHRDSPPAAERIEADAKYRGADVRSELADLIIAFRPTLIIAPDASDLHPDHCATHMFVHESLDAASARGVRVPAVAHYVIHEAPHRSDGSRFVRLPLTAAERAAKRQAIEAYRSQTTVMAAFMRSFEAPDERFAIGDRNPPAPCWCSGRNIAQ